MRRGGEVGGEKRKDKEKGREGRVFVPGLGLRDEEESEKRI